LDGFFSTEEEEPFFAFGIGLMLPLFQISSKLDTGFASILLVAAFNSKSSARFILPSSDSRANGGCGGFSKLDVCFFFSRENVND